MMSWSNSYFCYCLERSLVTYLYFNIKLIAVLLNSSWLYGTVVFFPLSLPSYTTGVSKADWPDLPLQLITESRTEQITDDSELSVTSPHTHTHPHPQ